MIVKLIEITKYFIKDKTNKHISKITSNKKHIPI